MADCGCKEIVVIQRVKFMDDAEGRVTNFQQRCMDLGVNVYIQDKEYEYSIEGGMKAAMEAVQGLSEGGWSVLSYGYYGGRRC